MFFEQVNYDARFLSLRTILRNEQLVGLLTLWVGGVVAYTHWNVPSGFGETVAKRKLSSK